MKRLILACVLLTSCGPAGNIELIDKINLTPRCSIYVVQTPGVGHYLYVVNSTNGVAVCR